MSFLRVIGKGTKTRLVPLGRFAINAIKNWLLEMILLKIRFWYQKNGLKIKTKSNQESRTHTSVSDATRQVHGGKEHPEDHQ